MNDNRKLILVEGIPGSGKTTLSEKIHNYISEKKSASLYQEGDGHPADLAWCACVPLEELSEIIVKNPKYEEPIKRVMYIEDGYAVIPYTKFNIEDEAFFKLMESYEVFDNRVGFSTFSNLHIKKWRKFGKNTIAIDEIAIFECAFLQNHINELLLFHCMSEEQIEEYMLELIDTVKDLNPILIYLSQPDVSETIKRVSMVRVNKEGEQIWLNRAISFIEESPYGKENSLSGFDGMISYFEDRKKLEINIMKKLPIDVHMIENPRYDWDQVWKDIREIIDSE